MQSTSISDSEAQSISNSISQSESASSFIYDSLSYTESVSDSESAVAESSIESMSELAGYQGSEYDGRDF
jgi:hypothetical protein